MSALNFAKTKFVKEKPHSSVTDWVDILTADNVSKEVYDGIPELVDAINLQASGPAEASRALRKKLKHGIPHQQYRSLVVLNALVENGGHKFQTSFADDQLIDTMKHLAADVHADVRVRKKLFAILASWHDQFKDDKSMSVVAGLHKQLRGEGKRLSTIEINNLVGLVPTAEDKRRIEKEEAQRKEMEEREEKEKAKKKAKANKAETKQARNRQKKPAFDFERDKPKVLNSIADASRASSNLVNAIMLVNPDKESLQENERVQECLEMAKQARKSVVRYIQLVEDEELIGTLIVTNERIISALEMYDRNCAGAMEDHADETAAITARMAAADIGTPESEVSRLQEKQRAAVQRALQNAESRNSGADDNGHVHPDLQDLSFGPLGHSSTNLPPPMRPSALSDDDYGHEEHGTYNVHGSLSDFSDYESSDEESRNRTGGPSRKRAYVTVSDDESVIAPFAGQREDPFADPFADESSSVHAR